jgi:hypothetical protein
MKDIDTPSSHTDPDPRLEYGAVSLTAPQGLISRYRSWRVSAVRYLPTTERPEKGGTIQLGGL